MNEYETSPEAQVLHTEETSKFYLEELERVTKQLADERALSEARKAAVDYHQNTLNKAKGILEEYLEELDGSDVDEWASSLCELLEVETSKEVSFTITATWNTTARVPRGFEFDASEVYIESGIRSLTLKYGYSGDDDVEFDDWISDPDVEVEED
jgi:hypothetical protein